MLEAGSSVLGVFNTAGWYFVAARNSNVFLETYSDNLGQSFDNPIFFNNKTKVILYNDKKSQNLVKIP